MSHQQRVKKERDVLFGESKNKILTGRLIALKQELNTVSEKIRN